MDGAAAGGCWSYFLFCCFLWLHLSPSFALSLSLETPQPPKTGPPLRPLSSITRIPFHRGTPFTSFRLDPSTVLQHLPSHSHSHSLLDELLTSLPRSSCVPEVLRVRLSYLSSSSPLQAIHPSVHPSIHTTSTPHPPTYPPANKPLGFHPIRRPSLLRLSSTQRNECRVTTRHCHPSERLLVGAEQSLQPRFCVAVSLCCPPSLPPSLPPSPPLCLLPPPSLPGQAVLDHTTRTTSKPDVAGTCNAQHTEACL